MPFLPLTTVLLGKIQVLSFYICFINSFDALPRRDEGLHGSALTTR